MRKAAKGKVSSRWIPSVPNYDSATLSLQGFVSPEKGNVMFAIDRVGITLWDEAFVYLESVRQSSPASVTGLLPIAAVSDKDIWVYSENMQTDFLLDPSLRSELSASLNGEFV